MLANSKPKTAGFTIVEIMIVLAVASLIILMVLQAIPTLQRNSRNHQRKEDVQTILGAISHWELNHSGTIPNPGAGDAFMQYTPPGYYAIGDVTVTAVPAGGSAAPAQTDIEKVSVYNHQKCTSVSTASSQGAGYYDIVAMYALETRTGSAAHCQQL